MENKITKTKFFTFFDPYFDYIDSGKLFRKPFAWLYGLLSVLNLIAPFYILYKLINLNAFDAPAKVVVMGIILWFVICFVGWFGFRFWLNRMCKLDDDRQDNDEFVAIPVLANFTQALGEWLGTVIAVVGFSVGVLTLFVPEIGQLSFDLGALLIVVAPVYGFFVIVIMRMFAEMIKALASIANNTKKK